MIEQVAAELPRRTRLVLAALGVAVLGTLLAASGAAGAEAKLAGVVWADADRAVAATGSTPTSPSPARASG